LYNGIVINYTAADPKDVKRQRDRDRYAKNKDEISNRRRQAWDFKKKPTDPVITENTLCDTQTTGQIDVTQQQYRAPAGGNVF
jgi:phage tail tape-measure protein